MSFLLDAFLWFRGVFGDPAITSMVWVSISIVAWLSRGNLTLNGDQFQTSCIFVIFGAVLYPMALGLGAWDPYRNGFSPTWLLLLVAALSLWAWWQRNWLGLLMLTVSTLSYALQLKESLNYWDYLIDPFIVTYCLLALLVRGWRTLNILKSRGDRGPDRLIE